MQNCASSADKFYTGPSGQISTVFSQIGTNLSKLRIGSKNSPPANHEAGRSAGFFGRRPHARPAACPS